MLLLYNLGIRFYFLLILAASAFNKKARLWIKGRKNAGLQVFKQSAWFHFASLGEFEQGRPVLEAYRAAYPGIGVVITFFSPSGYEVRKNTPLADAVYYLPLDTAANARAFIKNNNPVIAVFTKYEYWYHYFDELHKRNIPLYLISGIFRPNQVFFKWHGGLHRKMLGFVTRFFVQDEDSKNLLQQIGITNVSVSGDTRFDRVWANALQPRSFPAIEAFKGDQKVFIAGSTWPEDEVLLAQLVSDHPGWKFIFAPHEISEEKISRLIGILPENSVTRYSFISTQNSPLTTQNLIIDNIGMLSSLYQYGDVAYIGGGFGAGIHNTLEAAAFGLPVIFGPNYAKFREARELAALQLGFSIQDFEELKAAFLYLAEDEERRKAIGKKIRDYVREHTGATEMFMTHLRNSSHKITP
ncbi:MAG TPA: glycosyltransferase N-terminal domain-containing protein [Mucilaginibacter sp.]|nr:glycosyltransferase N-terminal domain-containing protein [Mucilaginibacter sp.]